MIPMLEKFVNQDTALDDSQGEANHDSQYYRHQIEDDAGEDQQHADALGDAPAGAN